MHLAAYLWLHIQNNKQSPFHLMVNFNALGQLQNLYQRIVGCGVPAA